MNVVCTPLGGGTCSSLNPAYVTGSYVPTVTSRVLFVGASKEPMCKIQAGKAAMGYTRDRSKKFPQRCGLLSTVCRHVPKSLGRMSLGEYGRTSTGAVLGKYESRFKY